ncbi:MAG: tRNA glutamyl-Q(34) synthetase GluQRS [Burkholderiales bacterium]
MTAGRYIGRFAPSPTGPLHAGSLVAAMASYLDAKSHSGQWLVRIEDIDEARTVDGAAEWILQSLFSLGMRWDGEVVWQSKRQDWYQAAFDRLGGHTYPCGCTRREIADSASFAGLRTGTATDGAAVYPGFCRAGLAPGKPARAYRLRVPESGDAGECIQFDDARIGLVSQHLSTEVGDFVLKRADGYWAYQLAVVVDDAAQCVSHVVRGADLLDSTARQIYLQRLLQLPTPRYLHVPVVVNRQGEKLSKQTGAPELDLQRPLDTLLDAARFLGLALTPPESIEQFWQSAIIAWSNTNSGV